MKRRLFGLFLALIVVFGFASFFVVPASAAEAMHMSADALAILKAEEGFSKTPYWDFAQWTVGYGTKCPDDKLEVYKQNGITEQEAEGLLQAFVTRFEAEINRFAEKNALTLTQNQFDALVLFSYNCGTAWTFDQKGGLYNAVVQGKTGNDMIYALSRWCNAGGQIRTYLLRRRLCEANMYINGQYSQKAPDNYGYVLYDACGGKVSPNVQGYDTTLTAQIIPTPTREGFIFGGWYTASEGGTKVTVLDAAVKNCRLYAHWVNQNGEAETLPGDGITVTVTINDLNVRQGPNTNYPSVGKVNTGDQLVITETAKSLTLDWGKFDGGWICLQYTNYDIVKDLQTQEPEQPKTRMGTVKVEEIQLRIRKGPSTAYEILGTLSNGTRVEILEQQITGTMAWGRITQGWISLSYVVLDPEEQKQEPSQPEQDSEETPEQQTWTGTVKVEDIPLRIRSGPSTATQIVGYLENNTRVTITQKTTSGTMTWGKIANGWISLDYVVLDSETQDQTEEPEKLTGTVKVGSMLRVRKGPGTSYAVTSYLSNGTKVEILEQKMVGIYRWGRIAQGWISLDYVVFDQQPESTVQTKTVTADCLRIRSGAGTNNTIVGYLYKGTKVEILETKTVSGSLWGRISNGWISLYYTA